MKTFFTQLPVIWWECLFSRTICKKATVMTTQTAYTSSLCVQTQRHISAYKSRNELSTCHQFVKCQILFIICTVLATSWCCLYWLTDLSTQSVWSFTHSYPIKKDRKKSKHSQTATYHKYKTCSWKSTTGTDTAKIATSCSCMHNKLNCLRTAGNCALPSVSCGIVQFY